MPIKWSPGCNCCACPTDILHPPNDWQGWTNPPPETTTGTVPTGTSTSITVLRPTCNWIVTINVDASNNSIGSLFSVGGLRAEIIELSPSDATVNPGLEVSTDEPGVCEIINLPTGAFTLTFAEMYDTTAAIRKRMVEVSQGVLVRARRCSTIEQEFDPNCVQDSVTINITAGNADIDIGTVQISGTIEDNESCPDFTCDPIPPICPAPLRRITGARTTFSGAGTESYIHHLVGDAIDNVGGCCQLRTVDYETNHQTINLSAANGTYFATLHVGGGTGSALVTADQLMLAESLPIDSCRLWNLARLWVWKFPTTFFAAPWYRKLKEAGFACSAGSNFETITNSTINYEVNARTGLVIRSTSGQAGWSLSTDNHPCPADGSGSNVPGSCDPATALCTDWTDCINAVESFTADGVFYSQISYLYCGEDDPGATREIIYDGPKSEIRRYGRFTSGGCTIDNVDYDEIITTAGQNISVAQLFDISFT